MTKHEIREDAENRFTSFFQKLVRVPKQEIDDKEREYKVQRKAEKADRPAKNA